MDVVNEGDVVGRVPVQAVPELSLDICIVTYLEILQHLQILHNCKFCSICIFASFASFAYFS